MSNASRDENNIPVLLGADSNDGVTPVQVTADPITHAVTVIDAMTGVDYGVENAVRDQNFIPVMLAVSDVDGTTPVEVYVDSATGAILVDTN